MCLPSDFCLSKVGGVDSDGAIASDDCERKEGSMLPVPSVVWPSSSLRNFLTFFVIFDVRAFIGSFE